MGSRGWLRDQSGRDCADWRPKEYWRPGTTATLDADLDGIHTGDGRYLVRSYATSFTIGRSRTARVDLDAYTLTLVRDGEVVRW
ncbi:hypothetical protein P3T39_000723 [Kitasatospora sp. GP82]|nr:hypothetical protein [Kitasatospora sp. GP82]